MKTTAMGLLGATVLWMAPLAPAQTVVPQGLAQGGLERVRILEDQQRKELRATEYLKVQKRGYTACNTGGWSSTTYFDFEDDDNSAATLDAFHGLLRTDFRAWGHWVTRDNVGVYLRLRKYDHHYYPGVGTLDPDTSKYDAFDLDLGYVDIPAKDSRIRVGRQFIQVGRGLTLSDNLDGISALFQRNAWAVHGFFARTSPMAENLDLTVAPLGSGGAFRDFGGIEASYTNRKGRRLYGYAVLQNDRTEFKPQRNATIDLSGYDHGYDANYLAIGADGPITRKLSGYAEIIHEGGRTASQNVPATGLLDTRESIAADAFIAALNYFCLDRRRTNLSLEYAIGTGDADRGSVMNQLLVGNTPGTRDNAFQYFGTYDLGLALSPRLSNLEVVRLGYSVKPFLDGRGRPREFQLGAKGSLYRKQNARCPISTSTATRSSRALHDVGTGIDLFAAWRVWSDTSVTVAWGAFLPGDANAPGFDTATQRLLVNMTATF
ncbi:MAG: hypothetical protein HY815_30770 [Candidatus Riflebacteria bacterium]|nr:hypothetical protein [Candidatus Riflebacteria bacterium]